MKTLMKTKFNYLGLLSGFNNFYAIRLTITIKRTFVTVDTTDAPICTTFAIKISWFKLLQNKLIVWSKEEIWCEQ